MTLPEFDARLPKAFLAVSYAPGTERSHDGPGGDHRVLAAAAMLSGAPAWPRGPCTSIWLAGDVEHGSHERLTMLLARMPSGAALAKEIGGVIPNRAQGAPRIGAVVGRVLGKLTAPFAVVSGTEETGEVVAATDFLGYRHIYWYQGDRWAAVSTSSLALARCTGTEFDEEALAARCLLGFHIGDATPFAGVRKLGPGGICVLADGKVRLDRYDATSSLADGAEQRRPSDLAHDVADLLKRMGDEQIEQYPGLVLQLSGGLDSRVQLAAIPPGLRAGVQALTFTQRGSPDLPIARHLAATYKLDHQILSLDPIADFDPAVAHALVRRAAQRHDCTGDPSAQAVLDWAEGQLGTGPRIHGLGGETARGLYYPGQRQHETVRPELVNRLARWRLFTNEAIDPACVGPSRAKWWREITLAQLQKIFSDYNTDWLTATDNFYLWHRMARWSGPRLSVACVERILLGTMLHPEFIALTRACRPEYKRGSHFMAMVLRELDPALARIQLDSGYVPWELAETNLLARARSGTVTGRTVARKVYQRLSKTRRPDTGAQVVADRLLVHWRSQPGLLDELADVELIDHDWLAELLDGRRTANTATIGLLATLQVMKEAVTA